MMTPTVDSSRRGLKSLLVLVGFRISGAFVLRPGGFLAATTTTTTASCRRCGASVHALSSSRPNNDGSAEEVKSAILEEIWPTKRGLSATPDQRARIEERISALEGMCPVEAPARDRRVAGHWFVRYTTAPPPSNGQLGPFVGVAEQEIGLSDGKYTNILNVGPNNWLGATLDADWTEWDGQLLKEKDEEGRKKWMKGAVKVENEGGNMEEPGSPLEDAPSENDGGIFGSISSLLSGEGKDQRAGKAEVKRDFGASSWRVTFDSLTIRLFGIPVVKKEFQDTVRVWKMTYIDDDTRIVRAGRTGKSEDDVVFYMTRQSGQ